MKRLCITLMTISAMFLFHSCAKEDLGTIKESGTMETTDVVLSSQVSGKVARIYSEEGANVKKGDILLEIEHEALDIQLRQAAASVEQARARLALLQSGARKEERAQAGEAVKQAESNFKLAEKDRARARTLYKSESVTRKSVDDAENRYDVALAQLSSSRENLAKVGSLSRKEEIDQAKAELDRAIAQMDLIRKSIRDCYISAPISGTVVKKYVEVGELLNPSSSLLKLSDLSRVLLKIYVSDKDLGRVKLGARAEVTNDTYPDKKYYGVVEFISPEAEFTPKNIQTRDERVKQVFAVKISIPNTSFELKSGMPADAVLR